MFKKFAFAAIAAVSLAAPAMAVPAWPKVDQAMGRPGAEQPGGVHRYAFPRSELAVPLDGVAIKPASALGSWTAFQPMGDQAMVMGDLVLTHEEVTPVVRKLLASFTITALHDHLLRSAPASMYMHVGAQGDPVQLAPALHDALTLSHTPLSPPAGVYQFSHPRTEAIRAEGMPAPASVGTATAINFQPTGEGKAAITATSSSLPAKLIQ